MDRLDGSATSISGLALLIHQFSEALSRADSDRELASLRDERRMASLAATYGLKNTLMIRKAIRDYPGATDRALMTKTRRRQSSGAASSTSTERTCGACVRACVRAWSYMYVVDIVATFIVNRHVDRVRGPYSSSKRLRP
jgi:hypothetical protein